MRLNAIRCLPCKGAGPVTSTSLKRRGGLPGTWGGGLEALGTGGDRHTCQKAALVWLGYP